MLNSLEKKLKKFDPKRPYIWELKITEKEFIALEDHIRPLSLDASNKTDALRIVTYMAEWYKRRYTNSSKQGYQAAFGNKSPNLEAAWETLGIDKEYLYTGESDQKLYTYSTFILGGLAIKFELQKNEKPFLKGLCRIYNNEDESFDRITDSNHSIAFKKSITSKRCLYDFLDAIITARENNEMLPFSAEDINDTASQINNLVELIKNINAEIRKSKFRFEWIIKNPSDENIIVRTLRLWLNPEEKGKLHHLLKTDRLKLWGFKKPEGMRYIEIGMRFLRDEHEVKTIKDIMYYRNTGDPEIGFIAEYPNYAICNNIPTYQFNKIQIISWEDGVELTRPILEESVDFDVIQLYREEKHGDTWTSRVDTDKETALLFSENWNLSADSVYKEYKVKKYYSRKCGEGDRCRWSIVPTSMSITHGTEVRTYYNRQGTVHLIPWLDKDTIQYNQEGKVNVYRYENEELIETPLFLIFNKTDISAMKMENDDENLTVHFEGLEIDLYEFKDLESGRYNIWSDDNLPQPGYNKLRLKIKDQYHIVEIFYVPDIIKRNLDNQSISYFCYNNDKKTNHCISDKDRVAEAISNKTKIEPTITIDISAQISENIISYAKIPVYRPARLREISHYGRPYLYTNNGKVLIPYILRYGIEINEFGEWGHKRYAGKDSRNIYKELQREGGMYKEINNIELSDTTLPENVYYIIQKNITNDSRLKYLYWNFAEGTRPTQVKDPENWKMEGGSVLFQKQERVSEKMRCEYKERTSNPFARNSNPIENTLNIFLIAVEFNQYFFHFEPLRNFANGLSNGRRDFWKELYEPLKTERNHVLTDKDKDELLRFTDEFLLDEIRSKLIEIFKTDNI